jgi:hypothetical protein
MRATIHKEQHKERTLFKKLLGFLFLVAAT